MATEDARYRQSTQFRLWSFSPGQLSDLRCKTNELAIASISARLSSQQNQQEQQQPLQLPDFLTQAEEHHLVTFYTVELLRAATFCELPTDVRATAAVFLRRFYVTNSIMTYPPTAMLKTALFFGSKAEGFYIRLSKIAEKFKGTTPEEILAGEFLLCEGIRFAFDVKHPYRALEGAVMELRRYEDIDDQRINNAHKRAREILKFSPLVTDAYFHYTPSQIMLAALSLADRELAERVILEGFKLGQKDRNVSAAASATTSVAGTPNPVGDSNGGELGAPPPTTATKSSKAKKKSELDRERIFGSDVRERILDTVESCRKMLATEPPERDTDYWGTKESSEIIKPLTRKLKKCRDPDRFDLVALQKARRERALNSVDSDDEGPSAKTKKGTLENDANIFGGGNIDRDAKRRKVAKVSDDPFGPPI